MHETSKALMRRLHDSRFATRYFVGDGIDIGAGGDVLGQYTELFPLMRSCRAWPNCGQRSSPTFSATPPKTTWK